MVQRDQSMLTFESDAVAGVTTIIEKLSVSEGSCYSAPRKNGKANHGL